MAKSGEKGGVAKKCGAPTQSYKGTHSTDFHAITDTLMEKQCDYLEPRLAQLHDMGQCTDDKLNVIHTELAELSGSIGSIKFEIMTLKRTVRGNSKSVANHKTALQMLEIKIADMEDSSRCCNICIVSLKEGTEESNAVRYLTL